MVMHLCQDTIPSDPLLSTDEAAAAECHAAAKATPICE
jgi:hypothetical protein